jgi:NAD(P)H-hydrate epimerase
VTHGAPLPRVAFPPALAADAHKGDAGRVVVAAGSRRMPGAAILVAQAAYRAGAGLVHLAARDAALLAVVPPAVPELVYLDLVGLGRTDLRAAVETCAPDALVLGPGLGQDARTRDIVQALLELVPQVPRVLDADALNVIAPEPERLRAARGPVVITPHPGEAGRLLRRPVSADPGERRAAALELTRRSGAVVCLKGQGTLVVSGERIAVNATGNPGMATAGAGDVLAGILGAYLARARQAGAGPGTFELARAAVAVHGLAGDLAARALGERALVASDLVRFLPEAQRALEAGTDR